jgi:hypothetical protein
VNKDTPFLPLVVTTNIDITPFTNLLQSCISNDLPLLKSQLAELPSSLPSLIQPIATLSAIRGHASILQFCLDNGAAFDDYLNRAAEIGSSKYPEVLEVLKAAGWKSKLQVTEEDEAKEGERGPDGRFTPAEIQRRFGDIPW